jgi:arginyl-tRNA synthetase
MIMTTLKEAIAQAAHITPEDVLLEHPADMARGDFSTSIALAHAKKQGKDPHTFADSVIAALEKNALPEVERIEKAGPGFINFYLSRNFFAQCTKDILEKGESWGRIDTLSGKRAMVEYTDANPFKEFHIGHLMSNAIGESLSRLVEYAGADIHRANYQGDVGVHVAQAVWAKQREPQLSWGEAYACGARSYAEHKAEIDVVNKKLYERSDEVLNAFYDKGKEESLRRFEEMYKVLDTRFDHYFFESVTAPIGKAYVLEHQEIFEESDEALVFRGEAYDPTLHTRVFINSQGIPTYEAKELGLAELKFQTWPHDISIVVTANEIVEYYKVVLKALEQGNPEYVQKIRHVTHGILKLPSGKMSSRTGEVIAARTLIDEVARAALEKMKERDLAEKKEIAQHVAVAAIKYSILKQTAGRDIIFDTEKSLSFEGDSGPYLQYAYTRSRSVLKKAQEANIGGDTTRVPPQSIQLERLLYRFPETISRSLSECAPHYLTTFLTEIASEFNRWYAVEKILDGTPESSYKVALTEAFSQTMKNGLWVLGIKTPEQM